MDAEAVRTLKSALEEGLRRLARAWAAYQPSIEPGRQSLSVVV